MRRFSVEQALRSLDPATRANAETALDSLLLEEEDWSDLQQLRLQEFLWYALPTKWLTDAREQHEIAWALADLLEAAGLERYAALCRSGPTHELLALWARDRDVARRRMQDLMDASGVVPPATPALTWGAMLGVAEHRAHSLVSAALEAAIVDGTLVPGKRGWRTVAAGLSEQRLRGPDPSDEHESLLDSVEQERQAHWLADVQRRTGITDDEVAELATALAGAADGAAFTAVSASLDPLRWFLGQLADGVAMTTHGYLPRQLALDANERYGWFDLSPAFKVRGERDLPELTLLHELSRESRLVALKQRRLRLTARGRSALGDDDALVGAVLGHLFTSDTWSGDSAVGLALVLVCEEPSTRTEIDAALLRFLSQRWRRGDKPLSILDIGGAARRVRTAARVFGWFEPDRPGSWGRAPELTAVGRAALLLGIRAVARGPKSF